MAGEAGHAASRAPFGRAARALKLLFAASVLDRRRESMLAAAALVSTITTTRHYSLVPSSSSSSPPSPFPPLGAVAATWQARWPATATRAAARGVLGRRKPGRALELGDCWSCRPSLLSGRLGDVFPQAGSAVRLFSLTRSGLRDGARLRRQSLLATLSPNLRVIRSLDTAAAAQPKPPLTPTSPLPPSPLPPSQLQSHLPPPPSQLPLPPPLPPHANVVKESVDGMAEQNDKGPKEAELLKEAELPKEAKLPKAVASGEAESTVVPKKDLWVRVKEGAKHYWDGTRLLAFEIKLSAKLLHKLTKGGKLTRREHRQLKRTTADMIRLVPFLVFVIVTIIEFLLPVFLKLFPSMLPSTFEDKDHVEAKRKKLLKVRLDVAEFLQETIGEISFQGNSSSAKAGKELAEFFRKIRIAGELASAEDISKMSKRFDDDVMLEHLSRPQLVSMCRYTNMSAFGTDALLRFQIRKKMQKLKADDKLIQAEGIDSLTFAELQQACSSRGIRTFGLTQACMREELQLWLDLHLNHQVPSVVLMLSRTLSHTE